MKAIPQLNWSKCQLLGTGGTLASLSWYLKSSFSTKASMMPWTIRSKIWDFLFKIFLEVGQYLKPFVSFLRSRVPEWESDKSKVWTSQASAWIRIPCKVKVKLLSRVWLFETPWTAAYQAPPSMGFSRQECWSGLPFPSPEGLPDPGVKPGSPAL